VFLHCLFIVCVLFCVLCCLFPIFVQVYRLLPRGGNPIAANKCQISSILSLSAPLFHWFGITQKEYRIFNNLTTGHTGPISLTSGKPMQIARGVFILSNLLVMLMTNKQLHIRCVLYSTVQKVGLRVRIQLGVS